MKDYLVYLQQIQVFLEFMYFIFCISLFKNTINFEQQNYLIKSFHMLSYGYPILICSIIYFFNPNIIQLPDSRSYLKWCYISTDNLIYRLIAINIPLIISWISCFYFYYKAKAYTKWTEGYVSLSNGKNLSNEVRTKLVLVPILFFTLRIGDFLYRLFQILNPSILFDTSFGKYLAFSCVIGDSLAGFINFIVFVIGTKRVRLAFYKKISQICCNQNKNSLQFEQSPSLNYS